MMTEDVAAHFLPKNTETMFAKVWFNLDLIKINAKIFAKIFDLYLWCEE